MKYTYRNGRRVQPDMELEKEEVVTEKKPVTAPKVSKKKAKKKVSKKSK